MTGSISAALHGGKGALKPKKPSRGQMTGAISASLHGGKGSLRPRKKAVAMPCGG